MRFLQLLVVFSLSFIFVIVEALFKKSLPVVLCGFLALEPGVCIGFTQVNQVLAKPPIIRTEADTIYSLADDFAIAQQTPYNSGRNEILVSSASTGAEQRFWTNLPGSGSFQLYELNLAKVKSQNSESLIRKTNAPIDAAVAQQRFSNIKSKFEQNRLTSILLADGSKAEFTTLKAVIRNADGSIAVTVDRSKASLDIDMLLATKGNVKAKKLVAQPQVTCEAQTAAEIVKVSTDIKQWSTAIAAQWKPDISWKDGLTQGLILEASRALESSLNEATSNSVALQKASCRQPVKCGQRRDTRAENIPGNQIITDLFRVPPGASGNLTLEYEFFQIPDRIEVSYNGKTQFAFGPAGGSGKKTFSLSDVEQGFVGIRVIGNPDAGTQWWYQISCKKRVEVVLFTGFSTNSLASSGGSVGIATLKRKIEQSFAGDSSLSLTTHQFDWDQQKKAEKEIRGVHGSNNKIDYLIIIGHSLGGDSAIDLAKMLGMGESNLKTNLLVQIDSVGNDDGTVSGKVGIAINYFQTHQPDVAFMGVNTNVSGAENINATAELKLDEACMKALEARISCEGNPPVCKHGCIDDHPKIHEAIIERIRNVIK